MSFMKLGLLVIIIKVLPVSKRRSKRKKIITLHCWLTLPKQNKDMNRNTKEKL